MGIPWRFDDVFYAEKVLEAWIIENIDKPAGNEFGTQLGLDDLVFTSIAGKPIDQGVISHTFKRIAIQVGLNGVRFHDLRHTFASLMLLRGAKPKVISEALGHSSVGFTLDVYSHIIDGMQSDAMALLDEVLPTGVSQKNNANLTPKLDIMSLVT